VPTADVIEPGAFSLQLEADGAPNPLLEGGQVHLFTQFGVSQGLEVGVDLTNLNHEVEWYADAKWQFVAESDSRPAVALGVLNLTNREGDRPWYLALSRDLPNLDSRLTVGFLRGDLRRGMIGLVRSLAPRTALQMDWTTGPEACATLGLSQDLGHDLCGLLYYAHNNTRSGEDFVGLNLTWTGAWR
jgi:hypothetical protein